MDSEHPKHVKERLNSLILKKIYDQQEKENKEVKSIEEVQSTVSIKQETEYDTSEDKSNTENAECNKPFVNGTVEHIDLFNTMSLTEILNEKRKALLRDPQVVIFLQNKIKYPE